MSVSPDFLQSPPVRRALERVARLAAAPVSVHFLGDDEEGPRILTTGSCTACRWVGSAPDGRGACRASRRPASARATGRDAPVPFVCHMGFACVSVRLLPGEAYVATIGPYTPSDAPGWAAGPDTLVYDAQSGAAAVGLDPDDAPRHWLADISAVPADAVYEVATWLVEEIARCHADWETADVDEEREEVEDEPKTASRRRRARAKRSPQAANPALAFVLTLTEGDAAATRRSVDAVLAEVSAAGRSTKDVSRLRNAVAVFAAWVVAAAEEAGIETAPTSAHLAAFGRDLEAAEDAEAIRAVLFGLLGTFRREARRAGETDEVIAQMSAAIEERLPGKVTLAETARALGRSPTSLTHRLQRRFGLSFTEYVGRLRVERAKALLRETSLTIAEVGARVGVDDSGNFGRLFKRHEGASPSAYRARIRKGK